MAWNLPKSSGPYHVACLDILTKTGLDSTLCRFYYPTEKFEPTESICPLWLSSPEYGYGFANFLKFGFAGGLLRWMFGSARVPVYWQGPLSLSQEKPRLPVVLFSHGLGANRTVYSYIAYEIASHGFFVAAIEHRDESASNTFYLEKTNSGDEKYDKVWLPYKRVQPATTEERELRNKQVHERAKEISKLMDSIELLNAGTLSNILSDFDLTVFKDKIDIDKAAVIGHSFGGATSITSLVKDLRFKAGIPLDVWMYPLGPEVYKANIDTPLLFINSESFQWEANIASIRKLDCDVTNTEAERKLVTLCGTVHHTQCDFAFLLSSEWLAKMIRFRGPADPKKANDVNMRLILCFLRKHLKLSFAQDEEIEQVVAENQGLIISGSNIEIDEERLEKSKASLRAGM